MTHLTNEFNYFAELAQAREAGVWTEKRNPKKDELIEAIAAHAKGNVIEQDSFVTPSAVSYEALFKVWSQKKEEKTKRTLTEAKPKKQSGYENALQVVQLLESFDYKTVSAQLNKSDTYIKRAQRAYEIYETSTIVKQWFDNGKVAWACIHKAAGSNPDKIGMTAIENKIKALGGI